MNQKILAAGFILLLFFGVTTQSSARVTADDPVRPLRDIVTVVHDQHLSLEHWGMYAKTNSRLSKGHKGYVQKVEELQSQLSGFQWTKVHKDAEGNLKITGTRTDPGTRVNERMTVLAYKRGEQWRAYTIYEAGGDHWDRETWQQFSPTFHDRLRHHFPQNPKVFSCVKAHLSGMVDGSLYNRAQRILREFSAMPVEQLKEKTFVSLSAYTKQWKPSIQTQGKRMNLQVALRTNGEKGATTVTIGTPIITTEY